MDVTRRSFLLGTGSATLLQPAFADEPSLPTVTKEATGARISLAGHLPWILRQQDFGRDATITCGDTWAKVSNVSLAGGARFDLTLGFRQTERGARAVLSYDGWPQAGATIVEAHIGSLLDGSGSIDLPLPAARAARIVADATSPKVGLPRRIALSLRRPLGPHGMVDPAQSISLTLEARSGRFRLPHEVSARALRLAPAPRRPSDPAWRADLVGADVPVNIRLGGWQGSAVNLAVPPGASAWVRDGAKHLRIAGRLRLDVLSGALREGPVICAEADLDQEGGRRSSSLLLDPGRWLMQTGQGLFGVSGGIPACDGAPSEAYRASTASQDGVLTAFDVPLGLHEHGVDVPGADLGRFDFGGCTCRLRLDGLARQGDGIDLPLAAHAGAQLTLPLDKATLRVVDARTLMSLDYRFRHFDLVADNRGRHLNRSPLPKRHDDQDEALLVVDFPPQHLMERAFLRRGPTLPDREAPVTPADLRSVHGTVGEAAKAARQRIAAAKADAEDHDPGLADTLPARRPFRAFSTLWTDCAKGLPEELPWIGPMGLLSSAARQLARKCAAQQRKADIDGLISRLGSPPGGAAGLASALADAVDALALPGLWLSQPALRGAAASATSADEAVKAMFGKAIAVPNEALGGLQAAWAAWTATHPSPATFFLAAEWPPELAGQDRLDAVLPEALQGKAPTRVAETDAAAFLVGRLQAAAATEQAEEPFERPNEAHLSGRSRLAFVVGDDIPLTREALTDWRRFDLRVVKRAFRPRKPDGSGATLSRISEILAFQGLQVGGTVAIRDWMAAIVAQAAPPDPFQTALELPSRLILSPAQDVRWTTPRPLPTFVARRFEREKTSPVWQAELFETIAEEPSLRAVWSGDFRPGAFVDPANVAAPEPGDWAPWAPSTTFRTAVQPRDRHELVGLTSLYGLPTLARRDVDGTLHRSQSRIPEGLTISGLKDPADVALYLPQSLAPRRLALSSLGASLDLDATFTPPATARAGATGTDGTPLFDTFGLARFSMQASYGHDEVVEVVRKGFLFPL